MKLRLWGIRKNLKREQWQDLLNQPNNIPATGLMTSSGHVKKQPSIQRALRRLKATPGVAPGQASSASVLSHPLSWMASSSPGPPVEQMSLETLGPGLPKQQSHGVARHLGLDGASFSPESALLRLGEATMQFNPADSAAPFASEFDDHMSFGLNLDFNSPLDNQWDTALFATDGHDMLGLDLNSSFDRNWQIPATAGTRLAHRASPTSTSQLFLDDDHFFGFNWKQAQVENHISPPVVTTSSPGDLNPLSIGAQLPAQNGTLERGNLDLWLPIPNTASADHVMLPAGSTKQWLKTLPFAKFEEYLHSRNIIFTNSEFSTQQRPGASLSGSFALSYLENSFYSGSRAMVQRPSGSQNPLQQLGKLLPGENTAVISEQQMTETRLVRILLFSMMNGFAGLHHIPMEDILKSMSHFGTSKLLLQILEEGPAFTSRTLGDNMFRAAIEAKDQHIVQLLLDRNLVDVNDTVCFFRNERYTPVERAASLQALGLVRILVGAGADVNKTHGNVNGGGALRELLSAAARLNNLGPHSRAVTATPELIGTLDFLIGKGSKVNLRLLNIYLELENFITNEVICLISQSIPPADHQSFFKNNGDDGINPSVSLVGRTAKELDDSTAVTIVQNIIELCERSGCSKCLERWPKTLEYAAAIGAERGHFKLVQLLIGHVPSTTKILNAAIRSNSKNLIRLVLDSDPKPDLDPPAQPLLLRSSYDILLTTPLADAVRTGNADLIKLLEDTGALNKLAEGNRLEALVLAAAEAGNVLYIEFLLRRASSSSHKYRAKWGAIRLALENDHDEVAKFLLSAGAQFTSGRKGRGPLRAALRKRDPELVRSLLSADIEYVHYEDIPKDVGSWFNTSILSDLAFVFPDLLQMLDQMEDSLLQNICKWCMETDNVMFFKIFLESVSSTSSIPWNSCLASAITMGHGEMVDLLLQNGANPFDGEVLKAAIPDRTEMLPLLFGEDQKKRRVRKCVGAHILKFVMAERPGSAEVLDALLESGLVNLTVAEPNRDRSQRSYPPSPPFRSEEMLTPLGLAIVGLSGYCETNLAAVNRLLRAGSDPNGIARITAGGPRAGQTVLMLALETGREDLVRLLVVEYKADVNKKTHLFIKRTPLQYAAELGNLDMVRLLLKLGADVNGEPAIRSGGTALQFAAISGNCNVAAELLEQGAPLHALPSKVNGRWPLEGAAEHGRIDMIQFLWRAKEFSLDGTGFQARHCLRAMDFARSNGHLGCRDLVAELSGFSGDRLESEDYGVPWLAY
jgi:ankyrin repeat protein